MRPWPLCLAHSGTDQMSGVFGRQGTLGSPTVSGWGRDRGSRAQPGRELYTAGETSGCAQGWTGEPAGQICLPGQETREPGSCVGPCPADLQAVLWQSVGPGSMESRAYPE